MSITLLPGLVLRHGTRTIEMVREIDDGMIQLEDCLTRRPLLESRAGLLKKIWNGTYKPVLSASASGETPTCSLGTVALSAHDLTPRHQALVERRLAYVRGLHAAHITRGQRKRIEQCIRTTAQRLGDGQPPSASTVMLWARRFGNADNSPMALVSANSQRRQPKRLPAALEELVTRILKQTYFTRERHSLRHAQRLIEIEVRRCVQAGDLPLGLAPPSMATLSRRVQAVDLYRRIAAREGPARARMVCRTTMEGGAAEYPLQRVEIDHTPLNWIVICERTGLPLGRPLLTAMIDAYAGYVLGIYVSFYGPGVTSVAGCIRNAVMPKDEFVAGLGLEHRWLAHGIGDEIVLDNGMEFHASAFLRMCWELGSHLTYCPVRTPWSKAHIERFFGTLNSLTLTRGRIRPRMANALDINPAKDAAITFSDFVKGMTMYVVDVYPLQINERKLARPYDLFAEGIERCPPARYPGSWEQMRLTSALSKELTVGPGGVELLGLPYGGPELLAMRRRYGERFRAVVKWDPDDIGEIYVQDPRTKEWVTSRCRWSEYATGLSWHQHRMVRKFARDDLKRDTSVQGLLNAWQRLHEFWGDATSRKTRSNAQAAARFAGLTSARVMSAPTHDSGPKASALITQADSMGAETPTELPELEGFLMESSS